MFNPVCRCHFARSAGWPAGLHHAVHCPQSSEQLRRHSVNLPICLKTSEKQHVAEWPNPATLYKAIPQRLHAHPLQHSKSLPPRASVVLCPTSFRAAGKAGQQTCFEDRSPRGSPLSKETRQPSERGFAGAGRTSGVSFGFPLGDGRNVCFKSKCAGLSPCRSIPIPQIPDATKTSKGRGQLLGIDSRDARQPQTRSPVNPTSTRFWGLGG